MSEGAALIGCERVSAEPFERLCVETRRSSRAVSVVLALLAMGYTKMRWFRHAGGFFTATDSHGIPTVIVIDTSPISDGFPTPRLSPARADSLQLLCVACLEDNRRLRCVRADYVALPDLRSLPKELALTLQRGVAWAFAENSPTRPVAAISR